jgi:GTP cyclohydrolase II
VLAAAAWLAAAALLLWVLGNAPLPAIGRALGQLTLWQIAALLAANGLVFALFSARWWLLLAALGWRAPFGLLALHRLAGFGLSYFTPGPQVGGEPVQALLLHRRHGVPVPAAAASVGVDRLLDGIVNLSVLALGLAVALGGWLPAGVDRIALLLPVLLLLALPLLYLGLLAAGRAPLLALIGRLPARLRRHRAIRQFQDVTRAAEQQAAALIRRRPGAVLLALAVALAGWAGMLAEYGLMLRFLGLAVTPVQVIASVTAARIAFLLPAPGGLGALEAGQVLVFESLGLDPALGLSASLLIRGRDVLFGLAGLGWAGLYREKRGMMASVTVIRRASARIPTGYGEFDLILYTTSQDDKEHLAFTLGDLRSRQPVLARIHSECFTGDVLGSRRCDCGDQLDEAMRLVAAEGVGVIVYLRQEGRGIGLLDKLRAYNLQDSGYDTVDANTLLGHAPDEREYTVAARIFEDLGVRSVRLMTNNPDKIGALAGLGLQVTARVPLQTPVYPENAHYLQTKASRMRHLLDVPFAPVQPAPNGAKPGSEAGQPA